MKKLIPFKAFLLLSVVILFASCTKEDVDDPIDNPTDQVGDIVSTVNLTGIYDVAVYSHYAYVGQNQSNLSVIDLSDINNPVVVSTIQPYGDMRKSFIHNKLLYIAGYTEGLYIYSISNPASPQYIDHIYPGDECSSVFLTDSFLITAGGISANGLLSIYDVNTRTLIGSYTNSATDETARGYQCLDIVGNYIYAGTNAGYMHIIDISDPSTPTLVSRYYHPGTPGHAPWLLGLQVSNNTAYLADWGAGFISVDVSDINNPTLLQAFTGGTDGTQEYDVIIDGNTAYVGNGWGGLLVMDITNPSNMTLKFEVNPNAASYLDIALYGDYVLAADNGNQMLSIIKVK